MYAGGVIQRTAALMVRGQRLASTIGRRSEGVNRLGGRRGGEETCGCFVSLH